MDVKFKNGLCNCFPSKIDGYGKYEWEDAYQLLNIPKLPDKLFNMICKPEPKLTVDQPVQSYDQKTVMQLCECISVKQFG